MHKLEHYDLGLDFLCVTRLTISRVLVRTVFRISSPNFLPGSFGSSSFQRAPASMQTPQTATAKHVPRSTMIVRGGEGFSFRNGGIVEYLDARNLTDFVHASDLILLGQRLENGLLYLGTSVEVSPSNAQDRQLSNRWIEVGGLSARVSAGIFASPGGWSLATEFLQLALVFIDASLQRADTNVIAGVDLAQTFQLRLRGNEFAFEFSRQRQSWRGLVPSHREWRSCSRTG